MTWLAWLRQSPAKPNSRHMLEHIERLKAWQALDLPAGIERQVHQNRLLKIAREGGQMTPADPAKFESQRRHATLVALAIEGMATVTDEIIDLHDRIIGKLFNAAKNKHQQQFQASGKAINDKVRMYGRIERTLFILDWLQSVELRRRVHAGLNKGEARNALARAVFFYRLGEIRDRSFEQQRYRASGLNLVTAAIVLWNTVYLERATSALRAHGKALDDTLLQYLSPLGWEHINLTGDYLWRSSAKVGAGSSGHCDRCHRLSVLYLMRWSLPPSQYYAEDRLSFGEPSWKTLRLLVSIWVRTLSIFIVRIIREGRFTVKKFTRPKLIEFLATCPATTIAMEACGGSHFMARKLAELGHFPKLISPQFVRPFVKSNKMTSLMLKLSVKQHHVHLCVSCSPEPNLSRQCELCIVSVNPWFRIR